MAKRGGARYIIREDDARRSYTDADLLFIAACRNREKPIPWKEIARKLQRTVQSVNDFWERRGNKHRVVLVSDEDRLAADHQIAILAPWPAHARFDGWRSTKEGSVPFHVYVTPARPMGYRSFTGNAAASCAESRAASNPR